MELKKLSGRRIELFIGSIEGGRKKILDATQPYMSFIGTIQYGERMDTTEACFFIIDDETRIEVRSNGELNRLYEHDRGRAIAMDVRTLSFSNINRLSRKFL